MGEVFLAEHKYIARRAAIKFLLPQLSKNSEVVVRFFNEARAASLIQHPGIVEVLDCEVHTDGRAYIVMELLRGENLRAYIDRRGKLDGDLPGAVAICRQVVGALGAAHAQGIVHRDLKPDNVFLHVPAGRAPAEPIVKLLDFGIAKLQGGGEAGSQTRTGQLLGTPLYMSPEQCRGARQVDSRSDIYSLGCIMFEIFCGRPPFIAEGLGDLMMGHITERPPDPLGLSPGLPSGIRQMLLRCLEKEPAARPTVNDLSGMLAAAGARETARLAVAVQVADPGGVPAPATSPSGAALPQASTVPSQPGQPSGPATPAPPTPAPAATPLVARPAARPFMPTPPPTTLGGGATELVIRAEARRRLRKRMAFGTLALGALAGAAVVWLRGAPETVAPVEPPRAAVVAPAEPAAKAPPAPEPPPAPRPRPVSAAITLTGLPASAVVRLDGQPASSPVAVPSGDELHRITVEADGFERWEQSVTGASDRTLAVQLKPKPPEARPKAKPKQRRERSDASRGFSGFSDL